MQSSIKRGCNEISIYEGDPATREQITTEAKKLIAAFPEISNDFLILLIDRITDNNFTADRVRDAINNIIDVSPYKRPAIADIISFDRKIKLFTYEEISAKCAPGYPAFEKFDRIDFYGRIRYVEK